MNLWRSSKTESGMSWTESHSVYTEAGFGQAAS